MSEERFGYTQSSITNEDNQNSGSSARMPLVIRVAEEVQPRDKLCGAVVSDLVVQPLRAQHAGYCYIAT